MTIDITFVSEPPAPKVDLIAIREKQLDEAFKPAGRKIDAEVLAPVKPVRKASRNRLSEGDK